MSGERPLRILLLEHEPQAPAGLFGDWAGARGHRVRTLRVPEIERWPAVDEADVVVSLGSDSSVHSSSDPWIARELAFLRAAHDARVPVFGICFGAQALASALGGTVSRAPALSPQWTIVRSPEPELIPPGPWFRWHEDVFTIPPGARDLGSEAGVRARVRGGTERRCAVPPRGHGRDREGVDRGSPPRARRRAPSTSRISAARSTAGRRGHPSGRATCSTGSRACGTARPA